MYIHVYTCTHTHTHTHTHTSWELFELVSMEIQVSQGAEVHNGGREVRKIVTAQVQIAELLQVT